ncbi:PH domain-containing protein [Roseiconus nitratireducens]|nr:PH domain-containing protein [Roseiconus nitratireducens]
MSSGNENDTSGADTMLYGCPHCQSNVQVERRFLGGTTECPRCGRPFQVEAPKAYPVHDPGPTEAAADVRDQPNQPSADVPQLVVHPVVFRRHFLGTVICILLVLAGLAGLVMGLADRTVLNLSGSALLISSGVLIVVALFFLLRWLILSRMQSLTLTNERLIYQYGLLHRGSSELRHEDVRNLKLSQNLAERILRFGDIAVSSAGQDDMEVVINDIPNPERVVDFIRRRQ